MRERRYHYERSYHAVGVPLPFEHLGWSRTSMRALGGLCPLSAAG